MTVRIAGVILAALLLAGCQSARVGVRQPRAILYKNVTVPMTAKRTPGPGATGLRIPPNLVIGQSRFYYIGVPLFGVVPTPGLTPLSVGWGDGSLETAMADGYLKEVVYADAQEIEVLGIFNKVVITAYGGQAGSIE